MRLGIVIAFLFLSVFSKADFARKHPLEFNAVLRNYFSVEARVIFKKYGYFTNLIRRGGVYAEQKDVYTELIFIADQ